MWENDAILDYTAEQSVFLLKCDEGDLALLYARQKPQRSKNNDKRNGTGKVDLQHAAMIRSDIFTYRSDFF